MINACCGSLLFPDRGADSVHLPEGCRDPAVEGQVGNGEQQGGQRQARVPGHHHAMRGAPDAAARDSHGGAAAAGLCTWQVRNAKPLTTKNNFLKRIIFRWFLGMDSFFFFNDVLLHGQRAYMERLRLGWNPVAFGGFLRVFEGKGHNRPTQRSWSS